MKLKTGEINPTAAAEVAPAARTAVAVLVAALLGLFILYGVGFAGPATLHNAAHDARHAFAFPCH
ncbi:MAG TPA: CbtB domain-containing protein [Geminicoccaceae bacterium]|nr:CbtB domain-containing protein [Geminicoccaceae bacterium]